MFISCFTFSKLIGTFRILFSLYTVFFICYITISYTHYYYEMIVYSIVGRRYKTKLMHGSQTRNIAVGKKKYKKENDIFILILYSTLN